MTGEFSIQAAALQSGLVNGIGIAIYHSLAHARFSAANGLQSVLPRHGDSYLLLGHPGVEHWPVLTCIDDFIHALSFCVTGNKTQISRSATNCTALSPSLSITLCLTLL